MITNPSPTAEAMRFTGNRLVERSQTPIGRSHPC